MPRATKPRRDSRFGCQGSVMWGRQPIACPERSRRGRPVERSSTRLSSAKLHAWPASAASKINSPRSTLFANNRKTLRVEPLRKALAHRNNFIVAKAADLVREFRMAQLIPDMLTAFDRFFDDAVKTDPQCWAKNAISRALFALDHQEPEVYLRGMQHIQKEPVWGGQSDTAGTLRATCALALVQCRSLTDAALLTHLIELAGDKDKAVRAEVMRAIEQVGSPPASLLLRLRAILGADEPEVLGACYSGILRLEGAKAIPWVCALPCERRR